MAQIVLGIGSSHTPMLNAPLEDWACFIEGDRRRPHLDKQGRPVTYDQLEQLAPADMARQITPEMFAARHKAAMAQVEHVGQVLRDARLDALIIVGDDQKELYQTDNLPAILLYHGETIRNVPLKETGRPRWAQQASARYYEQDTPREYPVDTRLALHLIDHLMDASFDLSVADCIREGEGEGHAFGFVHHRLLHGADLPVVPIFLNTYFPPNQPTPKRCHELGRAIRDAVARYDGDARIGVLASGGLSHFTVDEELDQRVIRALREKDAQALYELPRAQLNSGNSEIRNWICMAGASDHLALQSLEYIPGYRSPAGTGTGMCFAIWA